MSRPHQPRFQVSHLAELPDKSVLFETHSFQYRVDAREERKRHLLHDASGNSATPAQPRQSNTPRAWSPGQRRSVRSVPAASTSRSVKAQQGAARRKMGWTCEVCRVSNVPQWHASHCACALHARAPHFTIAPCWAGGCCFVWCGS